MTFFTEFHIKRISIAFIVILLILVISLIPFPKLCQIKEPVPIPNSAEVREQMIGQLNKGLGFLVLEQPSENEANYLERRLTWETGAQGIFSQIQELRDERTFASKEKLNKRLYFLQNNLLVSDREIKLFKISNLAKTDIQARIDVLNEFKNRI